eukprot:1194243-Prorocentrum_minimum.AAC.3
MTFYRPQTGHKGYDNNPGTHTEDETRVSEPPLTSYVLRLRLRRPEATTWLPRGFAALHLCRS